MKDEEAPTASYHPRRPSTSTMSGFMPVVDKLNAESECPRTPLAVNNSTFFSIDSLAGLAQSMSRVTYLEWLRSSQSGFKSGLPASVGIELTSSTFFMMRMVYGTRMGA